MGLPFHRTLGIAALFGAVFAAAPRAGEPNPIFDAIKPITAEELRGLWGVDLEIKNEPADRIIANLLSEMGLPLPSDWAARPANLSAPITGSWKGLSRPQILEEVCAKVGVYPDYPFSAESKGFTGHAVLPGARKPMPPGSVPPPPPPPPGSFGGSQFDSSGMEVRGFAPLPRPAPVVFAGPFIVLVGDPKVQASQGEASIPVFAWAPCISPVVAVLNNRFDEILEITPAGTITGMKHTEFKDSIGASGFSGEEIRQKGGGVPFPDGLVAGGRISYTKLTPADTGTGAIRGRLTILLPARVSPIALDAAATATRLGDDTVTISSKPLAGSADSIEKTITVEHQMCVVFAPAASEANRMKSPGGWYRGPMDAKVITANTVLKPGDPSPGVKFVSEMTYDSFDFEFPAVEFANAKEFPAGGEPTPTPEAIKLTFDGFAAPVEVTFVRFQPSVFKGDRDGCFKFVNRSNKPIRFVSMDYAYLDAGGEILKEFIGTVMDKAGKPLVGVGTEGEGCGNLGFLPEKAMGVRPRVTIVEFQDKTQWKSEEK